MAVNINPSLHYSISMKSKYCDSRRKTKSSEIPGCGEILPPSGGGAHCWDSLNGKQIFNSSFLPILSHKKKTIQVNKLFYFLGTEHTSRLAEEQQKWHPPFYSNTLVKTGRHTTSAEVKGQAALMWGSPADAFWGKGFLGGHIQQAQTAKRPEKNSSHGQGCELSSASETQTTEL